MVWYNVLSHNDTAQKLQMDQAHKEHPIPHIDQWAMGCQLCHMASQGRNELIYWKQKIVNLATFVITTGTMRCHLTTYGATSDDQVVKMTIFCFQCIYHYKVWIILIKVKWKDL